MPNEAGFECCTLPVMGAMDGASVLHSIMETGGWGNYLQKDESSDYFCGCPDSNSVFN